MATTNNNWRILLRPLSILYGWGVALRNYLFDQGILYEQTYPLPIICVGNITVGGTGKTPHVEYLLRLLGDRYRVALISRGYKRKTSGLVVAQPTSTAEEIGDEPRQILSKYPKLQIVIDGNRRRAMDYLMGLPLGRRPEVILMDDGYQHRYVKPSLSIILVDASRLPKDDRLLPEGQLRDSTSQLYRADCVVVTKCPEGINSMERKIIERGLRLYPHQQLFFSTIRPLAPRSLMELGAGDAVSCTIPPMANVLVLSGIAQGEQFVQQLASSYHVVDHLSFPDHHRYTTQDLERIDSLYTELQRKYAHAPLWCLCTEKDAVRLAQHRDKLSDELFSHLYYQPIEVRMLQKSMDFERMILREVTSTRQPL